MIEDFSRKSKDKEALAAAAKLIGTIKTENVVAALSLDEVKVLQEVGQTLSAGETPGKMHGSLNLDDELPPEVIQFRQNVRIGERTEDPMKRGHCISRFVSVDFGVSGFLTRA